MSFPCISSKMLFTLDIFKNYCNIPHTKLDTNNNKKLPTNIIDLYKIKINLMVRHYIHVQVLEKLWKYLYRVSLTRLLLRAVIQFKHAISYENCCRQVITCL